MAAKNVDIMELRQLLLLKEKGESNRSCEKLLSIHRNTINLTGASLKGRHVGRDL